MQTRALLLCVRFTLRSFVYLFIYCCNATIRGEIKIIILGPCQTRNKVQQLYHATLLLNKVA